MTPVPTASQPDLSASIEALPEAAERHTLLRVDLSDAEATADAVRKADPDLVAHLMAHLAAENHVDYSIEGPRAYGSTSSPDFVYIESKKDRTAVVRCDGGSSRGWSFGLQRMGSAS